MKILLNGAERQLDNATSIAALLAAGGYAKRPVAVEINREIVPRSMHSQHLLRDGDCVEIVQAMGGG